MHVAVGEMSVPFPLLHGNKIIQVILLLWNIRTADCTNSLCWNKLTSAALLHFTSFAFAIHSLLALTEDEKTPQKTQKPHMDFSFVHSVPFCVIIGVKPTQFWEFNVMGQRVVR